MHLSAANVLRFREGLCVSQHDRLVKNLKPEVYVRRSPLVQRLKLSVVDQVENLGVLYGLPAPARNSMLETFPANRPFDA